MIVLIPLMVFSIYATQTRVVWIGLVVVIMVFMATRARWTLLLVPVLAAAMFFGMPSIRARFNEIGNNYSSVAWREERWSRALEIPSKPQVLTVGAGLGAVDVTLKNLTHNEYVRLLTETGLIGLAITIVLYWQLAGIGIRGYRRGKSPYERDLMLAFLMAFASRVIIAISDNVIAFPVLEWYFWSFAAVIVVMNSAYNHDWMQEPATTEPAAEYPQRHKISRSTTSITGAAGRRRSTLRPQACSRRADTKSCTS